MAELIQLLSGIKTLLAVLVTFQELTMVVSFAILWVVWHIVREVEKK